MLVSIFQFFQSTDFFVPVESQTKSETLLGCHILHIPEWPCAVFFIVQVKDNGFFLDLKIIFIFRGEKNRDDPGFNNEKPQLPAF
jgi:hypothetical protein